MTEWFLRMAQRLRQKMDDRINIHKTPEQVFGHIYETGAWGKINGHAISGPGSYTKSVIDPYIKLIGNYLSSANPKKSVVDLGCGDMNVSQHFIDLCSHFVGIDVVPNLITELQTRFQNKPHVQFKCLDIVKDALPPAEVVIIRQVLQHCSNEQIARIVDQCKIYPVWFVTEHVFSSSDGSTPNKNLVHGRGNRVPFQSGIWLNKPPFSIPAENIRLVLETPGVGLLGQAQGIIQTHQVLWNQ